VHSQVLRETYFYSFLSSVYYRQEFQYTIHDDLWWDIYSKQLLDLMVACCVHHVDAVVIEGGQGIDVQVEQGMFWAHRLAFEKAMNKFRHVLKLEETLFDKFYYFDDNPEEATGQHREYFNYMVGRFSGFCKNMSYYWRVRFAEHGLNDITGVPHRCMFGNSDTPVHDLRYTIGHPFPYYYRTPTDPCGIWIKGRELRFVDFDAEYRARDQE